jgi:hypothetical protein
LADEGCPDGQNKPTKLFEPRYSHGRGESGARLFAVQIYCIGPMTGPSPITK